MADAGLIRDGSDDEDARRTSAAENEKTDAKTVTDTCQKRKPLYAELGAGRGYLSHFLLDAYGPLDLVLVEREAVRFKAERSMGAEADKRREAQTRDERRPARKETEKETKDADVDVDARAERDAETVRVRRAGAFVERLRIDIKDLNFSGVTAARGRDVVFVAKHLCGAATDLALRCALADEKESSLLVEEKNGGVRNGVRALGACVATCCHHRCEWGSYVNRAFMEAHGFGAREFGWLARISSWAVDGAHAASPKKTRKRRERSPRGRRRRRRRASRRRRRFRARKARAGGHGEDLPGRRPTAVPRVARVRRRRSRVLRFGVEPRKQTARGEEKARKLTERDACAVEFRRSPPRD